MTKLVDQINAEFRRILENNSNPYGVYKTLTEGMSAKGCTFGSGPMPLYVKPYFIDGARMPEIRWTTEVLMRVMNKMANLYYTNPETRSLFYLSPEETELADIPVGYHNRVQITRNDAFMTDDELLYIEFNADSPGGPMYSDVQGDLIQQSDIFKQLCQKFVVGRDLIMWQILRMLMTCYKEWGGKKDFPNICISAGAGGGTTPEFHAIVAWLKHLGFNAEFCGTTEWTYSGGRLQTPSGLEPDIIYRRGWIGDWIHHMEGIKPIIAALRDQKVCMVNPLNSTLAANKSVFAVLQMPEMKKLFTDEERNVIRKYLPWTRVFEKTKTEFYGDIIDLQDYVGKNKNKFVLKPIDQYGGKDVIVGYATESSEWEQWVDKACAPKGKFVVQEAVTIPEEELPVFEGEKLAFAKKKINVNFYCYGGIYTGGVVRSSDSPVINVHKGGGMTPIMFVDGIRH
ncbi:circularly permuted type 2 ATP-grasp protein [bacterium]|nr:circularly permuted type 2 ATP-grasp protein [candidate division CSSED10-310 bacterium]